MGFFKRPNPATPAPPFPHYAQNPHVQEQWQSNQTAPDGHRLDELRGLVQRMEMLSMQMDQLAASVQTNRQARCAVQTMPTTGASVNASSPPNSSPPLSQHPGPCPFAAHEGESRFVEIDDTDPEGGQPRAKASTNRSHAPSSSASNMSQAILEQLLREGSQARARTASPASGAFVPQSGAANGPSAYTHPQQAQAPNFAQTMQPHPRYTYADGLYSDMPGWESYSPSQGVNAQLPPMSAAGLSGSMASQILGGRPDSIHTASPFFHHQGVDAYGGILGSMANQPNQPNPATVPSMQANAQNLGYQFPNPFELAQGPHRPGFGNGFTMQQMPSVLGQIGAHFAMPPRHTMGRHASSGTNFGF